MMPAVTWLHGSWRRPVIHSVLTLLVVLGTLLNTIAIAAVGSGDISIRFAAAGYLTYDHKTGNALGPGLGDYGTGSVNKRTGVASSLQGSEYECGDIVKFYNVITVGAAAGPPPATLTVTNLFGKRTTSGGLVGFSEVVGVSLQKSDSGYRGDRGESVSPVSTAGSTATNITATVSITDLEPGEVVVVR